MNESSKLLLGAALVAVGFGVATMLGPPEGHSDWQDSLGPIEPAGQMARSTEPLQLRAAESTDSRYAASVPQINDSADERRQPPVWLKPVSGIQPVGMLAESSPNTVSEDRYASNVNMAVGQDTSGPLDSGSSPFTFSPPAARYAQVEDQTTELVDYQDAYWLEDEPSPTEQQQHIVADGDTLSDIAEIYLDDASREWEIYHLNRDQLSSPALLPIGAVLTIPAREVVEPQAEMVVDGFQQTAPELSQTPYSNLESVEISAVNDGSLQADYASVTEPVQSNPIRSSGYASVDLDLVPVKPVSETNTMPQVQLLSPIAVD